MSELSSSNYRSLMISAIVLFAVGWIGLYLLVTTMLPTVGPRWLFFFLLTLAMSGTALPFVWVIHWRFGRENPAPQSVLLRQGLLVGLFAALCVWLQINRSLSLPLALLLAAGIGAFEWFLRLLERNTRRQVR